MVISYLPCQTGIGSLCKEAELIHIYEKIAMVVQL